MEEIIPTSNNDDENTFNDHKSVEEDGVARHKVARTTLHITSGGLEKTQSSMIYMNRRSSQTK